MLTALIVVAVRQLFLAVAAVSWVVACGRVSQHREMASGGSGGDDIGAAGASLGGTAVGGTGGAVLGGTGTGGGDIFLCSEPVPDPPLRPLDPWQLRNELEIFGAVTLPPMPNASPIYSTDPPVELDPRFLEQYAELATQLASRVTESSAALEDFLGCDMSDDGAACREKLDDFVISRLFRGREDDGTRTRLAQVFDTGQNLGNSFLKGAQAVLESALQSREFLYRVELGEPSAKQSPDTLRLTGIEIASRLSFLLWNRGPDDLLLDAGRTGELDTAAGIELQARRLLADPRAVNAVQRFYRALLSVEEDRAASSTYPEFTDQIASLVGQELESFVTHATFDPPGDFQQLFAPQTWVNAPLAQFYGLSGPAGGELQPTSLDPTRYAGIVTQPAWLVSVSQSTNPTMRGYVLGRALLCLDVPPEPPDLPLTLPAEVPQPATTRQRFEQHASEPICRACHQMMDPLGFALEHFDAVGRYRETEAGLPIDASGEVAVLPEPFDGAVELASEIAANPTSQDCFVQQWARYAYGRSVADAAECTRRQLQERFLASGQNVLDLIVGLTQTDLFVTRKRPAGLK